MKAALALIAVLMLAAPLAGCGGDDGDDDGAPPEATAPATTEPEPGEEPAGGDEAGRVLFAEQASPPCGSCHTLADAETTGTVGPNLDELQPDAEQVRSAMQTGPGAMPTYDQLGESEIDQLAEYVAGAAGG